MAKEYDNDKIISTFIDLGIHRWGGRFDYDDVEEYIDEDHLFKIHCRLHGDFSQSPLDHLNSTIACPQCGPLIKKVSSVKDYKKVVNEAHDIHKGKYDYGLMEYFKASAYINIICWLHGLFQVQPGDHRRKDRDPQGCPTCSSRMLTYEEFVEKAIKAHGDRYDYTSAIYAGTGKKLIIICKLHGPWSTRPADHIYGKHPHGCPECGGSRRMTKDEFIEASKDIHGENAFDYSKTEYQNNKTPLTLICKKAGHEFITTSSSHLTHKSGCPSCKIFKNEDYVRKVLERIFGNKFPQGRHDFLKYPRTNIKLELDGYCKNQELAFEYNGIQHYQFTPYFHRIIENYQSQIARDEFKVKQCDKHGIALMIIPYTITGKNGIDEFICNWLIEKGFYDTIDRRILQDLGFHR